jgi:hypothetical protein
MDHLHHVGQIPGRDWRRSAVIQAVDTLRVTFQEQGLVGPLRRVQVQNLKWYQCFSYTRTGFN